jgi:hypothetical protein
LLRNIIPVGLWHREMMREFHDGQNSAEDRPWLAHISAGGGAVFADFIDNSSTSRSLRPSVDEIIGACCDSLQKT